MIDESGAANSGGERRRGRIRRGQGPDARRQVDCFDFSEPEALIQRMELAGCRALSVWQGPALLARVRHSPPNVGRAKRELVLVNILVSGSSSLQQAGREAVLKPGDLAICTTGQPFELEFAADFQQTIVAFPGAAVRTDVPSLQHRTARRLAGTHKCVVVLRDLVAAFRASEHPAARASLGQALVHALAACGHELGEDVPNPRLDQQAGPLDALPPPLQRQQRRSRAQLHSALSGPSPRESDVLHLIARGCSYADAAAALNVSVNTVCTHLRSLYSKLGVHSKNEAVFEARLLGWLS